MTTSERPLLLMFDVNETLSDMSPMAQRFEDVGAPGHLAKTWFAGLLRDAFALTAVGQNQSFATLAAEALRVTLDSHPLGRTVEDAVQHVMEGFAGLPVHPDVPDGVRSLSDSGIRLVTLSNGSASVAEGLFQRAGIRDRFEALLSVEDADLWKPAACSYAYALEQTGVEATDAMLVAVHPWDIDGAARAGLATGWINRTGGPYPKYFTAPDVLAGRDTELLAELDLVKEAGAAFHRAVAGLPRPAFMDDRDDPWAYGDRLAWEDVEPEADLETGAVIEQLLAHRRPVTSPSQVVHGDLLPNVLAGDGLVPGIIDWPPYFRPRGFGEAVAVHDAITFRGGSMSLLDSWATGPDWDQLLVRALLYRLGPTGIFATRDRLMGGLVTHVERARPLLAAVLARLG